MPKMQNFMAICHVLYKRDIGNLRYLRYHFKNFPDSCRGLFTKKFRSSIRKKEKSGASLGSIFKFEKNKIFIQYGEN